MGNVYVVYGFGKDNRREVIPARNMLEAAKQFLKSNNIVKMTEEELDYYRRWDCAVYKYSEVDMDTPLGVGRYRYRE